MAQEGMKGLAGFPIPVTPAESGKRKWLRKG